MARYADAIFWIANNDDTEFLSDANGSMSLTACMVVDLFNKTDEQVKADLIKKLTRIGRPPEIDF